MTLDVPLAWALVVLFALTMYVILDGFDLGVGMLLLTARSEKDRELMVRSIAPVWDGNETWLVLVGVGLLGGFPAAYGIALPAFYLPLIVMLLCLAFRGTAFEFRFQSERPWIWDVAFSVGSWGAALCQGLIVGALLTGIRVRDLTFAGSPLDCLRPFAVLTALLVAFTYATLGATWLIFRTTGALSTFCRVCARVAGAALALSALLGVLAAPWLAPELTAHAHWSPAGVALAAVIWIGVAAVMLWSLSRPSDIAPFACAIILALFVVIAFVSTVWPYLIPYELSFRQAASVERSQLALLIGAFLILPFVLAYSAYAYFVFRGKVAPEPDELATSSDGTR